jgi:hypothetical protein
MSGADGTPEDTLRRGDPPVHLVMPDLVLEHQFLAFEQVDLQPGMVAGLGHGLHRPGEDTRHLQLVRHRGSNPVEEGQLPRLAAQAFLEGLLTPGDDLRRIRGVLLGRPQPPLVFPWHPVSMRGLVSAVRVTLRLAVRVWF